MAEDTAKNRKVGCGGWGEEAIHVADLGECKAKEIGCRNVLNRGQSNAKVRLREVMQGKGKSQFTIIRTGRHGTNGNSSHCEP